MYPDEVETIIGEQEEANAIALTNSITRYALNFSFRTICTPLAGVKITPRR